MSGLVAPKPGSIVDPQVNKVVEFLRSLGLPADNIIAAPQERAIVGDNLQLYFQSLAPEVKREARYLSKFAVGAVLGLFDYALNSVWNEVVIALRGKAIAYGTDIFFDAAVGGRLRDTFKNEEDISSLKDSVLLDTCKKLELISETTAKKLAHILDMRNDIGVSHPTNYTINAFELLGWLQTCVQDVLNDRPSEAAIRVKEFLDNLKRSAVVFEEQQVKQVEPHLNSLATHHAARILRILFGIFVSSDTSATLAKNISLFAPFVWSSCTDEIKYELGIKLEGYKNNLHKDKYDRGIAFFEHCKGHKFRSPSERSVVLDELTNDLMDKHTGWDNFHHEVPIMERILGYVDSAGDIPDSVAPSLIRAVMWCRIGRGVQYCNGVPPGGLPLYDKFIEMVGDKFAPTFMSNFGDVAIQRKLRNEICLKQAAVMIAKAKTKVVGERMLECLSYLEDRMAATGIESFDDKFWEISKGLVSRFL